MRLTWSAPVSNGGSAITDYIIQRSPNGSSSWVTINDGVRSTTGYTVTGLANGTRYYFRVFAKNGPRATSPASNIANAVPRTKPTAPRSLVAAANNVSGQIRLTWVAPASNGGSAITDYIIQRSPNGSSSWVTINDGVRSTTGYTVTGLANGTRYYFRVFARNAAGQSPASNVVSGIPRTITVPGALSYFDVYSDYSGFYLYWGDPVSTGGSPLTEFVIQYYDYDDGSWLTLGYAEPWQRDEFVDAPGYGCGRFRIAAANAVGVGPYSAPVEACYSGAAAQVEGPTKPAADELVPVGPWVEASGVPVCDTATGVTTVTWTVSNPADAAVRVFGSLLVFGPDGVEMAPGASATATSTMVGPARAVTISNDFHDAGWSQVVSPTVNVPACEAAGTPSTRVVAAGGAVGGGVWCAGV